MNMINYMASMIRKDLYGNSTLLYHGMILKKKLRPVGLTNSAKKPVSTGLGRVWKTGWTGLCPISTTIDWSREEKPTGRLPLCRYNRVLCGALPG